MIAGPARQRLPDALARPLQAVVLSRGAADWQPAVAAGVLRELPALRRLQIRFSFDGEVGPGWDKNVDLVVQHQA